MMKLIVKIFAVLFIVSCTKPDTENDSLTPGFLKGDGVFIINEGNFRAGNGSISFYSFDSTRVFNNVFQRLNNRILGDIPNSMNFHGEKAYIVVNNSGKIEVADDKSMLSVNTITGLNSPRNIAFTGNGMGYVTSMYSDSLAVIDTRNNDVSGYINIRRTSESIEIIGMNAFVAQWVGGKEIMVINTGTNRVIDSIEVGIEPESMVVDRNNTLWVLCNGGWSGEYSAELLAINPTTFEISKRLVFPSKPANPTCLQINGGGDTLYFIQNGIRRLPISANELPSTPLIPQEGHSFYKLGINPANGNILVTDAVDYQQKGYVIHYDPNGIMKAQYQADIIPGFMWFKNQGK